MNSYVVYRIFNKKNGRFYIGSTSNACARKYEHFGQLRTGKHTNRNLQQDFNTFREASFVFEIIHDGFSSRQAMLVKEYAIILKTFSVNYNEHTDCPILDMSKKTKSRRILKCKPKGKKRHGKALGRKLKIEHPELDKILESKAERERIRAQFSEKFKVGIL